MDWDWVTKYAVPIIGAIATFTAIPVFFWTNLRKNARRLAIIDLATKRIAFWNQFLTTVNLATAEGSPERKVEQDKVYQAILRIHSDALLQTEALVRNQKIRRELTWRTFRPEREKLKKWYYVFFWGYFAILSIATLLTAIAVLVLLEYEVLYKNSIHNASSLFLACGIIISFFFMARLFAFQAEKLKHDIPIPPIIDVV